MRRTTLTSYHFTLYRQHCIAASVEFICRFQDDPFACSVSHQPPVKDSKLQIVYGENGFTSLALMEHVVFSGGVSLDVLMREQFEMKQEYRDTIASKTRKFAKIWKHR